MLTKNLLKYKIKAGNLYPKFIPIHDQEVGEMVSEMINDFEKHGTNNSYQELENKLLEKAYSSHPEFPAFSKLLFDRCDMQGDEEEGTQTRRWDWIMQAQELRQENLFQDISSFQETFSSQGGFSFETFKTEFYADLPENQKIQKFDSIKPKELISRYNVAQVQGLLLKSQFIEVEAAGSPQNTRPFLRSLKFHQLLFHDNVSLKNDKKLAIKIDGPLSIFSHTLTYGSRLANFFPHILNLDAWTLSAEIKLGKKTLKLELDDHAPLISHYKAHENYIPEEFELFFQDFKKKYHDEWEIDYNTELLHSGDQRYSFPDFVFKDKLSDQPTIYVELFHRWHAGQLTQRLKDLEKTPSTRLLLGVCRSIAKSEKIKYLLDQSFFFQSQGFIFTDFPVTKIVSEVLRKSRTSKEGKKPPRALQES